MTSISSAIEYVIKKRPYLESALVDNIVNLSALARKLKPEVVEVLGRDINEGAITMALTRLVSRLELASNIKRQRIVDNLGDIIVRSGLCDYTYINSSDMVRKQSLLLEKINDMADAFCTFSQGISETTLVVSSSISHIVEEIFAEERIVAEAAELSSITIKMPIENSIYPGVYYFVFKELAWDNINIREVASTTNEFTVVVADSDIHKAFTILMDSKKKFKI